jgi:outer membrane protein TolC
VKNKKSTATATATALETAQTVTFEQIAQRAYQLYESRGRQEGSDLDDWLQAERELTQTID